MKHFLKTAIVPLMVIDLIGSILFVDVWSTVGLQGAYLFGWLLSRIPGKFWLAMLEDAPWWLVFAALFDGTNN